MAVALLSSSSSSSPVVSALRTHFSAALTSIARRTKPAAKRCIILSGGVDTCAILAAASEQNMSFAGAITVVTGDDSPDLPFAIAAAKEHELPHHVVRLTAEELVSRYLPETVELLKTFDGMTLRNSLVIDAAMKKARELGFDHAIVGDGADELFGGYSFTWGMEADPAGWKEKRDKMCANWTFATSALAGAAGITAHSPYTEPSFVAWAVAETGREDCIGRAPIAVEHGGPVVEHETGKMVLRRAYDTGSSWRRKDPIEVGSGVTIISEDPFWSGLISDADFEAAAADLRGRGFLLQSKEHLANFRAFEDAFGRDGARHPTKKRLETGEGCVGCCFEIGAATWCEVCGAYPAQREREATVATTSSSS